MATEANETLAIGEQLVEFCRKGENIKAIETLYSDDILSVEHCCAPGMDQEMKGKEAVLGKNHWWIENHEVHRSEVEGPFAHGDRFIVPMEVEITAKAGPMEGKRFSMKEMALYTVAGGKIVKEEFFQAKQAFGN